MICPRCGCRENDERLVQAPAQMPWHCSLCDWSTTAGALRQLQSQVQSHWQSFEKLNWGGADTPTEYRQAAQHLQSINEALAPYQVEVYRQDDRHDPEWWLEAAAEADEDAEYERLFSLYETAEDAGDTIAALTALNQIKRQFDLTAPQWRRVGELLEKIGEKAQAARAYRRALVLNDKVGVKRRLTELEKELGGEPS